jgi:parallel beta-helix repeat protein
MRLALGLALVGAAVASAGAAMTGSVAAVTCLGMIVRPGTSIQAAIDASPTGTTFCLKAGTYKPARPLRPKDGQKFIGEPGTVIDGRHVVKEGFANSAIRVTVRGLVIRNFGVAIKAGKYWTIANNTLAYNTYNGARLTHHGTLRNNHIHHNVYGGVFGFGDGLLVVGNEIAYNHLRSGPCTGKFIKTVNLIVRNNYAHHNSCPVLWSDNNGYRPLFEGNRVTNNSGQAIDCEVSYKCIIRSNTVSNNTKGIMASSSPDVQIYDNTVVNNSEFGIRIHDQGGRSDQPSQYGAHTPKNNFVHHNRITMTTGYTGATKLPEVNDFVFSAQANNRFENNTYRVNFGTRRYLHWRNALRSWRQWRSYGHDTFGSFSVF